MHTYFYLHVRRLLDKFLFSVTTNVVVIRFLELFNQCSRPFLNITRFFVAPSGAPHDVNVQVLDSRTIKVSWQVCTYFFI